MRLARNVVRLRARPTYFPSGNNAQLNLFTDSRLRQPLNRRRRVRYIEQSQSARAITKIWLYDLYILHTFSKDGSC